ncbi:hypothetical protein [Pelomonas sp. BJYL3]|uniref:hypothetical protein n=1 Tax=Pelomonas sp. BJYL3 TaxID=2976697 RepID=UPI0022B35B54|nr:hypothetical protein [Pelomonas sp. BJYL3]
MQTWYRVTVRLESIGAEARTLYSRGRDGGIEHWFEGGLRHELFLRPGGESETIELRPGESVSLSALIQCLCGLTIAEGTKWLSHESNRGTVACGEVVAVHEAWSEGQSPDLPSDANWAGHLLF